MPAARGKSSIAPAVGARHPGAMKRIILALAVLLPACASAPRAAPAASAPVVSSGNAGAIERVLRSAGGRDAASVEAVERALGRPDVRRQDGAGAALTYRLDGCALLLMFAADSQNQLRLAEAHPGPRQAGSARPSLEQCAAAAAARSG